MIIGHPSNKELMAHYIESLGAEEFPFSTGYTYTIVIWEEAAKKLKDARSYWIEFLQNIIGMENVTERVGFEKKVIGPDGNTKRIDVYIPQTLVLIEQKSKGIALDKPQPGHNNMTPYEQAKMYDNSLPHSEKSRWIMILLLCLRSFKKLTQLTTEPSCRRMVLI